MEFTASNATVTMFGRIVAHSSLKYSVKQEKALYHVAGQNEPFARIDGKRESSGEITLPKSEFMALCQSLPDGADPLDIVSFDVTVTYLNASSQVCVDILKDCAFTEWAKEYKAGEAKVIEVTLPLMPLRIVTNAS